MFGENGNKILGIIPARGGSVRIPRKNLCMVGGRTLLQRAIDCAVQSRCFDTIVVSSDDVEILEIASNTPGVVPMYRPASISAPESPAVEYVKQVWRSLPGHSAFVIVQPSSPFTSPDDVFEVVKRIGSIFVDSVVSVTRAPHHVHPGKFLRMNNEKLAPMLTEQGMAAHEMSEVYIRNGSLYASRSHVIQNGNLLGDSILGYLMPPERSLDINDKTDLAVAEVMASRGTNGN